MIRLRDVAAAVLLCAVSVPGPALAGSVKAIVEEVDADAADISFMEYLAAGRSISLGRAGRVVIGYLKSCLREVVVGGTVVIGEEKSTVLGGKVRRSRVECDGGKLLLTAEQAGKSGVLVFRKGQAAKEGGAVTPSLRIFSLEPVIRIANRPATATFERLDDSESGFTVTLDDGIVDLAKQKKSLMRGGIYRVSGGGKARVFRVDPGAVEGGPLIGRYVAF